MIRNDDDDLERIRAILENRDPEDSFKVLHSKYRPAVEIFFYRRGFSRSEVPELAQDVFLQVFKELSTFRGESTFRSWLFAVASNLCRNVWKHAGRDKRNAKEIPLEGELRLGVEDTLPAPEAGPERKLFEKERTATLESAIERLSERERQCVRLRLQDYDYRQIAVVLGVKDGTVKALLHQARRRLAEILGDDLDLWKDTS